MPASRADEKKDYANAKRNYDAAVQLHPKNCTAYAHRGLFFFGHKQYALAAKDFDTALSLQRTVLEYATGGDGLTARPEDMTWPWLILISYSVFIMFIREIRFAPNC